MLDSRPWKLTVTAASMPYQLDGDAVPTSRTASRRTWISSAEGTVIRVDPRSVWISGDHPIALRHSLPEAADLTPLVGRRVRVTLVHSARPDGGVTQTLTVTGDDGRLHVIAHAGHANGIAHTLGRISVYVALSQRPEGPMVFGTARMQSLVRVGESVRVSDGEDGYVMHFQARPADGNAAYSIVSSSLWAERPTRA